MELSMATICIDSGQRCLPTDVRRKLLNHDKSTKRDEVTRHTCKPAVAFRPSIKIEPDNNVPNRRPAAYAAGRLLGTLLSGSIFMLGRNATAGLQVCLVTSSLLVLLSWFSSLRLTSVGKHL